MLIAGNWKMHTDFDAARALAQEVVEKVGTPNGVQVAVCPPAVNLPAVSRVVRDTPVRLGAQNMHHEVEGAFTGEVSAQMLTAVSCHYVILGHSERRQYFNETDSGVAKKVRRAIAHSLVPIVCVGESLEQRKEGKAEDVVRSQVETALERLELSDPSRLVLAYEPIWAIGTGESASPEQAQEMHAALRRILVQQFGDAVGDSIHLLYGGSMKPHNAEELLQQADVDGGLIGGASLKAADFAAIVAAAESIAVAA